MTKTQYVLKVEKRTEAGKGKSRRMRRSGKIPAVIYSRGHDSELLLVDSSEWDTLSNHDINLIDLSGLGAENRKALIKDVQIDHLKDKVLHIDFQEIKMDEIITTEVAVHSVGTPEGESKGGVLEQLHHELSVSCLPGDLPEFIEVNIEKLDIGDNITVADLELPENVKAELPEDTVLFHVAVPATEEEEETDEEAETGSEEAALVGEEDEE